MVDHCKKNHASRQDYLRLQKLGYALCRLKDEITESEEESEEGDSQTSSLHSSYDLSPEENKENKRFGQKNLRSFSAPSSPLRRTAKALE